MTIGKVVRKGLLGLKNSKTGSKELKRFKEIYRTVYKHARKKGQTHKQALNYCWNVYSDQAPHKEKAIIRNVLRKSSMITRNKLRNMIIQEMRYANEGDVIQMSDYVPSAGAPTAEEGTPFEMFLSKMHTDMMEFMEENFETMTPEEGNFLDELLDSIEEMLGIDDEEGIDVPGDDDDLISDIEDDD